MTGPAVSEGESAKDTSDASGGAQWMDSHGFHFPVNGIGPVRTAPVIEVEPYQCGDFLDFKLAERCAAHRCC